MCTAHFAPVLCRLPRLHGSGAGIPGIGILIYSWYCSIGISSGDGICSRSRDGAQRTWESEKPEPYAPVKDFDDWISHSTDTQVRSILPILPCWKQRDNHQQWWWRLHHTNSSLQHCCTSSRCSHRKEHVKSWGKLETTFSMLTDNCAWCTERPIRKAARDFSRKLWHTSLVPRLKTWKTVWTNFWNWWDDTMRRTVPIPFPIKWKRRALFQTRRSLWRHICSWMLVNWETSTHYAWRLRITWGADAIFKTTSASNTHDEDSMEVDAVSRKGKGKEK